MPDLVMDSNGRPDLSSATQDSEGVYQGDGWRYVPQDSARNDKDTLYLDGASFNLSGASIWCNVVVSPRTTVENASFNYHANPSGFPSVTNNGILQSCMFIECNITNNSTIQKSTIEDCIITNNATIRDSLFSINSSATLPFKFEKSGSITDSVFDFNPTTYGLTLNVHSLQASPIKALDISTASNPITYLYLRSNVFYTIGYPKIKVYCYNPDNPTGGSYKVCSINGVPAKSYDPDFGYANDSYIFTVQDEDVELSSSETTAPALEMDYNGWPKTDNMTSYNGVYYGDGWKYENGTLTLKSGEYNFSNSKDGLGQLAPDVNLVVTGATLKGGAFNQIPEGLTADNVQPIILNGSGLNGSGSIEAVNGLSSQKWSKTLYAIKDSQVEIKASVPLTDINCRAIKSRYYLDNNDKTALRFTANFSFLDTYGGPELILNKSSRTNLIMKEDGSPDLEGIPYDWSGEHLANIYTGDGWRYVDGPSKYLELTAHSYNFRHCDPLNNKISNELAAVTCDITNSSGATIEDGIFKNFVENYGGTINGGTFAAGLLVRYATEQGTVTGGAFNGNTALSDKAHPVTVHDGHILKVNDTEPLVLDSSRHLTTGTEWNLYSYEGTIVTVTADTDITNINGWNIGRFPASSYPNGADDKKTVSFQMPDGPVVLNDTLYTLDIIRGTMQGNTSVCVPAGTELPLVADEPAKNETFLGWTLSDESLLTDGKLNDPNYKTITIKMKDASATAEAMFQKDTPAYTLTVTGGGLVNGKTSAVVEAGDEVRLTVGEMQEGMSFNYWDLPTALTQALTDNDSSFSNKVEPLTFTMPTNLSKYTEDKSFTIRLDIRPAELPDDDDGPSVLGTMATVAVGGAAAGILVWQGVSLGVDSYLQLSLPGGVAVPTNRRELVKLLWETAGKPDVVLPALYGDVSAEDGELQKATRWAIDNGLVKPADEGDASRFDPDRSVSKYEVARAWFKVKKLMK